MQRESYEFVGEKDEAVGKLIASLPRVEAPSDFEMRVRARIASHPSAGSSWLTPLVRVAVPAALLLVVGTYFGYYALYPSATSPATDIVSAPVVAPQKSVPAAVNETAVAPDVATVAPIPQRSNEPDRRPSSPSRGTSEKSGGGTLDSALKETKPISQPGRTSPSLQSINPADGGPGISPKDVLQQIGIQASFDSAVWKVGSVKPNSVAYKAGVRPGDIVEALNDQPLTDHTVLGRRFTGTSVRVLRDGRSIKLELKP